MKNEPETNENLRRKAEEQLMQDGVSLQSMPHADVQALLHELQVHQIELEMQNEELQRAKLELDDALQKYTDLYDFAPVGYFTLDGNGDIRQTNLTGARFLGADRSRLMNGRFGLFVSPETRPIFNACIGRAFESGIEDMCEVVLVTETHATRHVQLRSAASGNSEEVRIAVVDITARKQAGEESERRSAELESFIASIADGVALLDSHGNVTFMNDDGMDILGVPLGETFKDFTGRYRALTLEGDPIPRKENAVLRALGGEAVADMRVKLITPWDKEVTLSVSASPVLDHEGQVIGATMVFREQSGRVAFEKERQELLEREHHIAEVLQKALIPTTVYDIPGCEIAVRYEPAYKEAEVGGDFYDFFLLEDGKVGIVIGDVVGKGLQAAITVAAARHSIRSYAYIDPRPGRVMTLANDALCRNEPGESESTVLTAIFAVIDTRFGGISYANGGHEPAVLRRVDGSLDKLEIEGRAMGFMGDFDYREGGLRLESGDMVVMVTDGITEARPDSHSFFGIEGVEQYLSEQPNSSPGDIADGLLKAAKDHAGGALADDVAIVVVLLT